MSQVWNITSSVIRKLQQTFTCLKSTTGTQEKNEKYIQNWE